MTEWFEVQGMIETVESVIKEVDYEANTHSHICDMGDEFRTVMSEAKVSLEMGVARLKEVLEALPHYDLD